MISFKSDVKGAMAALENWQKNAVPAAAVSSLTRSARKARQAALREISASLGVARKAVLISVIKARRQKMVAAIVASGRVVGLHHANPTQTRRGVKAGKGTGRKLYAGTWLGEAERFGGAGGTTKRVFKRARGARRRGPPPHRSQLPIKAMGITSPARELDDKVDIRSEIKREAIELFKRDFPRQLQYRLDKLSK